MADVSNYEVRFFYWGRGLSAVLWLWRCQVPEWEILSNLRAYGFWIKDDQRSGVAEYHGEQRPDSTMWVPPGNIAAIVPIGDQHDT